MMFFNKNGIGSNPNYAVGSYNNLRDFEIRRLRSSFFSYKIIGYGDIVEEDGEIIINDLVLYTRSTAPKTTHIFLSLAPLKNVDFIKYTIKEIMDKNPEIKKIRAVTTQKVLDYGFKKTWEDVGLKYELVLREFENPDDNIVSYAFIEKEMI